MKLKAIIVDDEPIARNFLERYCDKNGNIEVAGSFPSASSALDFLKLNEIDIIFLDVEMPDINGFQLIDQLQYLPKIILTTSKTDYAFEAYQHNVADYLKKPFTYNRFADAVSKVIDKEVQAPPDANQEDIFIKADAKLTRLSYGDILYIESVGDYVKYITGTKHY